MDKQDAQIAAEKKKHFKEMEKVEGDCQAEKRLMERQTADGERRVGILTETMKKATALYESQRADFLKVMKAQSAKVLEEEKLNNDVVAKVQAAEKKYAEKRTEVMRGFSNINKNVVDLMQSNVNAGDLARKAMSNSKTVGELKQTLALAVTNTEKEKPQKA